MTEVLFYHLQRKRLEDALPGLLETSLQRGWRVTVQSSNEERVEALDAHLWTWRDDAFLPHGTHKQADTADQPILLTVNEHNPNGANVRFLIDGAPLPEDADTYHRIVLMFDGDDEDAVSAARACWTRVKEKGFDSTYWQPDEQGRWVKKA